ncbi:MAG: hypothetical protein A3J94_14725 [Syntrophus sp. RIFOXYC2_FULL_54_9]|nr:MAG: hypothetical protein A3J94_14725 [Syntrophus sp. RIFOXYC2_FULL_54_9]HBB18566.1 hypothetical protein [Syntrophus sp. (in: bacteria)]
MSALAIFVEGQTELVFVERLLFEMFGYQHLRIERQQQHGGLYHEIGIRGAPPENAYHNVLIVNCACDGKVLPAIEERANNLRNAGYGRILGLRDIYPRSSDELEEIYELTANRLASMPLPCKLIIVVREIEAWFLADTEHFSYYNPLLTLAFIQKQIGIDVEQQDVEQIPHPAELLRNIYNLVGGTYDKKLKEAHRVVAILNYEYLYLDAPASVPALKKFVEELDVAI